jgi:hypothetical protein
MSILEGVVHMWKVSRSTHRKLITILALLSVLGLTATTAFAATPHFQPNITFKIGSLIADGELAGLDQQKVTVTLNATGIATVVCVHDDGDHDADDGEFPASNHPQVSAVGSQSYAPPYVNGKIAFHVETNEPTVTVADAGCPHGDRASRSDDDDDWTVKIVSVAWTDAQLVLKDTITPTTTYDQRSFNCKTHKHGVKCKPKKHHGDDD